MAELILEALQQAWTNYLHAIRSFLPRVLVTLSIVLAGWLMAVVMRYATRRVLAWARFDRLVERTGAADALRRGDLPPASAVLASLVFWVVFVGFLLSGVDALGLTAVEGLVQRFLLFVPQLLVAAVILVLGLAAANFAWRATLLSAVNAHLPSARLVAGAVRFLILVLSVAMALEQVAVARTVVLTAFAIAFGAIMLGLAIAFGIGGGGIARRILEQQFPEAPERKGEPFSHL